MTVYYKMRGIDPDCTSLTYRDWIVSVTPDTDGSRYVGTKCGVSPLTSIVIVNKWEVVDKPPLTTQYTENIGWRVSSSDTDNFYDVFTDLADDIDNSFYNLPVRSVAWFGAVGNGIADDTAAVQAAHDSLLNGGTVYFPPGTYKVGSVSITNPTKIDLNAGAAINASASLLFTVHAVNFTIHGVDRDSSSITSASGGSIIKLLGKFPGVTDGGNGRCQMLIQNTGFYGGGGSSKFIDASNTNYNNGTFNPATDFQFSEGTFRIAGCSINGFGSRAVIIGTSFYYWEIESTHFNLNVGALRAGFNSDGWLHNCIITSGGNAAQVELLGPDQHVTKTVFLGGFQFDMSEPDIDIIPEGSITHGWIWIQDNRFGTEREALSPTRSRIRGKYSGNANNVASPVVMTSNLVVGPGGAFIDLVRESDLVTGTWQDANGHSLTNGQTALVKIYDSIDPSFNGLVTITATSNTTFTYTSIGSDDFTTGVIVAADTRAISIENPINRWSISDNDFYGFTTIVDDAQAMIQGGLNNQASNSQFIDNRITPPAMCGWQAFRNGGRQFSNIRLPQGATSDSISPQVLLLETINGLTNRIVRSEELDNVSWTKTNVTVTTDIDDPWGTTRAQTLTRDGYSSFEKISQNVDITDNPTDLTIKFWARAGTLDTLFVLIHDLNQAENVEGHLFHLTSDWRPYKMRVCGIVSGNSVSLSLYPGGTSQFYGSIDLCAVQVSDVDSSYIPTASVIAYNNDLGLRFEKALDFGETNIVREYVQSRGEAVPTASIIGGFSASGSSVVVESGSTDTLGTLIITIGADTPGDQGIVEVTFGTAFSGTTVLPSIELASGSADWYPINAKSITAYSNTKFRAYLYQGTAFSAGSTVRLIYRITGQK